MSSSGLYEPRCEKTDIRGFRPGFTQSQAVQLHKMARGLKEEGLFSLCSENKGADQLCGYCEADLRLCFRICKKPFFSKRGSYLLWFSSHLNRRLIGELIVRIKASKPVKNKICWQRLETVLIKVMVSHLSCILIR